ncbi:tRNA-(ms[2]io[6]A)-hydroxylase [Nannocystis sp. ILAH1]|uniref:tRNA-(ms[2]io[6]A)-hydroxylase n=1 Tax=Nannocystis sp. ILAH1 TaxID=2996789 RepID=UPI0022707228|nr:tRNA-(ms[2]io[6]A)-hydroxylase [Nannocystis sp. ILAH1]MCY0988417.1 tRNA-(ms[2]io[6]A)-hydroxylase [Nannocystis sp. ILAH1]
MLHLAAPTDERWAARAREHLPEILLDHAHCEKKAASTALSLIFRYPERPAMVVPLSRLAREELAHFEEVVAVMRARGLEFRRQTPSPYAAKLMAAARTHEPMRLLDTLLCCSLIEARSCERMRLLAEVLDDPGLVKLYRGLLACEARHFHSYVELARELELVPEAELMARLDTLAAHEAEVLRGDPGEPRLHSAVDPALK